MNTNKPYEIIADTRKMSHQDWLAMRKAGIGGSDCAPAVGLSRWKSPFQLWSEKTNRITPTKAGEAAYWGSVMEPILRNEFAKRTNLEVHELPAFLRSMEHPFMLANIDGYVKKFFRLYTRNQWKRERLAVSFHIEEDSCDPKSYRRFPVLCAGLA